MLQLVEKVRMTFTDFATSQILFADVLALRGRKGSLQAIEGSQTANWLESKHPLISRFQQFG